MIKVLLALRTHALAHDGTEEGIACEGTPVESRTIKVKGKAFLFLGAGAVRLKLAASFGEAQERGAADPRVVAGAGGWIKLVVVDGALPKVPVARWIDESYALMADAAPRSEGEREAEGAGVTAMTDEDSDEARAARAAQRRRDQAAVEQMSARQALASERAVWSGFLRACAPWGWAFDSTFSYMIGLCTAGAIYGALWVSFMFLGVSFTGFFDALGSASSVWLPLASFAFAFALPYVLRAIATPAAERAADTEQQWIAALPFPRPPLPVVARAYAATASARGGARFRVSLYYGKVERPEAQVAALLERASIPGAVSTHYDDELRIDMTVPGGQDYKVSRNIRLLFHDLAVGVLAPLYKEAPFDHIELGR